MVAHEFPRDHVLRPVRVLVFIDMNVSEPVSVPGADVVVVVKQLRLQNKQIIEVHAVAMCEGAMIRLPQHLTGLVLTRRRLLPGGLEILFSYADPPQGFPRRHGGIFARQVLYEAFHEGELVAFVNHCKLPRSSQFFALPAQHV